MASSITAILLLGYPWYMERMDCPDLEVETHRVLLAWYTIPASEYVALWLPSCLRKGMDCSDLEVETHLPTSCCFAWYAYPQYRCAILGLPRGCGEMDILLLWSEPEK